MYNYSGCSIERTCFFFFKRKVLLETILGWVAEIIFAVVFL